MTDSKKSTWATRERRVYPRLTVRARVVVDRDGFAAPYFMEDISASGALLTGGPAIKEEEVIRLFLDVAYHPTIKLAARVLRHVDNDDFSGVIVVFGLPGVPARDAIEEALALAGGDRSEQKFVMLACDGETPEILRAAEAAGFKTVNPTTRLEALCALHDPRLNVKAMLAGPYLGGADGLDLIEYAAESMPEVARIMVGKVYDHRTERAALLANQCIDALCADEVQAVLKSLGGPT